jgi:hypothetical protein
MVLGLKRPSKRWTLVTAFPWQTIWGMYMINTPTNTRNVKNEWRYNSRAISSQIWTTSEYENHVLQIKNNRQNNLVHEVL